MLAIGCVLVLIGMASSTEVPRIRMNDGRQMPAIALGTFLGAGQNGLAAPEDNQLRDAVLAAIDLGYRHIDTASIYQTERQVGEAVKMKVDEGVVTREEMFITTKLWNTHHKREEVTQALRKSLYELGLNYVDLYLVHWPMGLNADYTFSSVDFMETWRGMEDAQRLGLARSIGLSNFNEEQVARVLREGTVPPAALQIEVHPQLIQQSLLAYSRAHNITVMGYSPLGALVPRWGARLPGPAAEPAMLALAAKYGKTVQQLALRWAVERNVVPLPKSVNPKRLKENIDIFDFRLTDEEVQLISSYDNHLRITLPSFWQEHPYYPFEKVDNPIGDPFVKKV